MLSWIIWILGTVIPTLILAGLSIQHQPDSTPKKRWLLIGFVCLLTAIVSTVGFLDSSKTAENIEKIVSGVVQVSENLNKQQQDLGKQSQDLKHVGGDLRQVGTDLKQVGSELTQQSSDLKATMQVARMNLAGVLDLQFQNAIHNETEAGYSTLEGNIEWQLKLFDLGIDERILKQERLFRDTVFASQPVELQALNQAIITNLQDLVGPIKQLEKNRQDVLTVINESRKKSPIRPEFIESALFSIQGPLDENRLPRVIEDFKPVPKNSAELRNRVAIYSDLVFEYRRINTQLAAALRQWELASRAEAYANLTNLIDKQRRNIMAGKPPLDPQTDNK
jgi:hypothetical protein